MYGKKADIEINSTKTVFEVADESGHFLSSKVIP